MNPKGLNTAYLFTYFLITPLALLSSAARTDVLTGIDVLEKENFASLQGAQVALITNHTGVNRVGVSIVDLLAKEKKVTLKCILSPEHGFRGDRVHGETVSDSIDQKTGVPIYSLYGEATRPTEAMLKDVDTLVYDIQDIGTRFYTYITTMGLALEVAKKHNMRFVVLDRPNPIRADILEGDILDEDVKRLTGYYPIPVRYGLTIGELANWFNQKMNINAQLTIVQMKNWKRSLWFNQTGLTFIPPSPNIPTLISALLYPGIGCFEATNISVGRGTDKPFQVFGAPWINHKALVAFLKDQNFQGVIFKPVKFTPRNDIYKDELCYGVQMIVTDRNALRPFSIFLAAFSFLWQEHPTDFQPHWEEVRVVTGSHRLQKALENKISLDSLLAEYAKTIDVFKNQISPYYFYK